MFNEIKNAGISFFKQMKDLYTVYAPQEIQNTVQGISGAIGNLFGQVKQFGEKLIGQAVIKAFQASHKFGEVLQKVGSTFETVKEGLMTAKNAVVDLLKGVANIPNVLMGFLSSLFQPTEKADAPVAQRADNIPASVVREQQSPRENASTLRNLAREQQSPENDRLVSVAEKRKRLGL
jgi:hypothetical protein